MSFLGLVLRRAARHWQMLLTLGLGVVIATALLASAPVLVNTVVEFGLRRTLLSADPLAGNLRLRAYDRLSAGEFAALDDQVNAAVAGRLGAYNPRVVPSVGGQWLYPWTDEQIAADERLIVRFYGDDAELQEAAVLNAGQWPDPSAVTDGTTIRAAIGADLAAAYDLQPGDRLPLSAKRDEAQPGLFLEVAGVAGARNPGDPFWFGEFSPLRAQSDERWQAQYSALVPRAAFFPMAEAISPDVPYEASWSVLLDPARFDADQLAGAGVAVDALGADLRTLSPSVTLDTGLPAVLANFAAQSSAVRAPLYFLTAEVVLLALYYVIMVASLSVRQVEREFAVLQSRGASGSQIFRLQATEALLVAAVAFISGPVIGVALVQALAVFGPLADVGQAGWGLSVPALAWIAAAVGAIACLIGLLLPVGSAVDRSIVSFQQESARATKPPLWQRAYLDVIVLVIGLVLLWRLRYAGGLAGVSGEVDWLLLLSPVALLIGAGTILLRLFPLVLNGLARLAARGRGLPAALALWSAARNPTHAARLVLLLTLAVALGILATGINATLDASETERARYAAGGDVRLVSARQISLSAVDDLRDLPGVTGATTAYRSDGSLTIGRSYLQFGLLGVDPDTFGPIAAYRSDFADPPLPGLLDELRPKEAAPAPGLPLPGKPAALGLWVWAAEDVNEYSGFSMPQGASDLDRIGLNVRLVTALGEVLNVRLDPQPAPENDAAPEVASAGSWRYFQAVLPELSDNSFPLAFDTLTIDNRARTQTEFPRQLPATMDLAIDEVTVVDATGESQVVTDFERDLQTYYAVDAEPVVLFPDDQMRDGEGSLRLQVLFDPEGSLVLGPGAVDQAAAVQVPALASASFLAATDTAVGDTVNVTVDSRPVTVRLAGAVRYFPTMYEDLDAGYLIADRSALLRVLNDEGERAINPNEALLAVEGEAGREALAAATAGLPGLSEIVEAETVRLGIKADPMGLGLRSVTLFGYALTALLSLVGFATYFYFSARQRESLYGVLRSIGLSPGQLYATLVLEQVVLILAGVAIGTGLGLLLNQITLPGLPITFGDRPPTPPFIARNDWAAVFRIYLTLTVAFLLCLGAATALLWRTNLHRALRVGEE